MTDDKKWVYFFGDGQSEGDPEERDILGGKGAGLAAMSRAGLPVPPGFTISAECCPEIEKSGGKWPEGLEAQVREALTRLERLTGRQFGHGARPLLVAVRSGAKISMIVKSADRSFSNSTVSGTGIETFLFRFHFLT